jgi:hypothetical protein
MRIRIWLVLSLCVSGSTWLYVHRILEPWTQYVYVEKGDMIARLGDFYSPWVGTRELLLHRRNPYGPEVSREIQIAFYGHAINQSYEQPEIRLVNEQRFAYPVYEVFLMAPLAYANFADVQRWAHFVLGLLTALNVFLCLSMLHWRLPWEAVTAMTLFTLSSPQIAQGLRHEQLGMVVGCLLTAAAWCVNKNRLATAGVLLAISTIKPQMVLLPLCWFVIWAVGNSRERWRVLAGFMATLAALIGGGELILHGWLGYFFTGIIAYRRYAPNSSVLQMALGETLGQIFGVFIVIGLLVLAWQNRKVAGHSRDFIFIAALFLMGALLTFPLFTPFNQVMLILPAMLILRDWKSLPRFSRLLFIVIMGWPWIVSSLLLFFPPALNSSSRIPLLPSFLVSFVPLILPLILMSGQRKADEPRLPTASLALL